MKFRNAIIASLLLPLIFVGGLAGQDPAPTVIKAKVYFSLPLTDGTTSQAVVLPGTPGSGQAYLVFVVGGKPTIWTLSIGDVAPAPPVTPPVVPPVVPPVPPVPTPGSLHALFLYDASTVSTLPKEQAGIITGEAVRGYLTNHKAEARFFDATQDASKESADLQAWIKRPHASLPWVILSNGKDLYEGPWPATEAATVDLLKKYGGP